MSESNGKFDVVILNGRVMDPETDFDAVRNVGIKNGKITTITKEKIDGVDVNPDPASGADAVVGWSEHARAPDSGHCPGRGGWFWL